MRRKFCKDNLSILVLQETKYLSISIFTIWINNNEILINRMDFPIKTPHYYIIQSSVRISATLEFQKPLTDIFV